MGEGNCFLRRILGIGVSIFDDIEVKADLRGRDKLDPCLFEQVLQFFDLAFVIGGDEQGRPLSFIMYFRSWS